MRYAKNLLGIIGGTPLVRINKLNPNPANLILAKLEKFNPTGSVKDRIALSMIESAERSGELTRDKVVIESTSGNTGIGLALVCNVKGYRLKLVMPETMSEERRGIICAYGAEMVLTPGEKGIDGAAEYVRREVEAHPERYFWPNQYENASNVTAHFENTGIEILDDTSGRVTMFVAGLGTTGTLMGVSKRLKRYNPDIRIIGVMPHPNTGLQGLKNLDTQEVPGIYEPDRLDELVKVTDEQALAMARRLTVEEGIFSGMSSGAAMHVAVEKSRELSDQVIVVLLPDGGEKYITTELYCRLVCDKECEIRGDAYPKATQNE